MKQRIVFVSQREADAYVAAHPGTQWVYDEIAFLWVVELGEDD